MRHRLSVRTWIACVIASGMCAGAQPANAASITHLTPFSGSLFDSLSVDPFDGTLGTLDSIHVLISGTLSVTGVTGLFLVPQGPAGPLPVPYQYEIDVTQEFQGLIGKYFHFNDPAQFQFPGMASGTGEGFAIDSQFSYDFTLNASTDLVGFVIPSTSTSTGALIPPLTGVTGLRNHFLDDIFPDEIDFSQIATALSFVPTQTPTTITGFSSLGLLEMRYDYTPTPAEVPEPASLGLLGAGVAAALAKRRRRLRR